MFDIGAMELFLVAVIALVVVGPKELPKLLRTVGGLVRKARELTAEFKDGVESLAAEAEQHIDPFDDLKKEEGLKPGMSPEDITDHIMANRENEANKVANKVASEGTSENDAAETKPKEKADASAGSDKKGEAAS